MLDKWKFLGRVVEAGFSQRSLAKKIGISKNTLNSKVNGRGCFDTDQIDKICSVLGITSGKEKADIFLADSSQNRDELHDA